MHGVFPVAKSADFAGNPLGVTRGILKVVELYLANMIRRAIGRN